MLYLQRRAGRKRRPCIVRSNDSALDAGDIHFGHIDHSRPFLMGDIAPSAIDDNAAMIGVG